METKEITGKPERKVASWRGCLGSIIILIVFSIIVFVAGKNNDAVLKAGLAGIAAGFMSMIVLFFAMPAHHKLKSIGVTFAIAAILFFGLIVFGLLRGDTNPDSPAYRDFADMSPFFAITGVISALIAAIGVWLGRRIAPKS